MKMSPYIMPSREKESMLGVYRVKKGLTIAELAKKVKSNAQTLVGLDNGMMSPLDRYNNIRSVVLKLSIILNVSIGKLFPRYFCDFERAVETKEIKKLSIRYTAKEIFSGGLSEYSQNNSYEAEIKSNSNYDLMILALNTIPFRPQEKFVLENHILNEKSLRDTGKIIGLSAERIRGIESKIIRRIRYFIEGYKIYGVLPKYTKSSRHRLYYDEKFNQKLQQLQGGA